MEMQQWILYVLFSYMSMSANIKYWAMDKDDYAIWHIYLAGNNNTHSGVQAECTIFCLILTKSGFLNGFS
jgi:hypothetical protein